MVAHFGLLRYSATRRLQFHSRGRWDKLGGNSQGGSHDQWIAARKKLGQGEGSSPISATLSRERRELPWELVDKDYTFEGESGKVSLEDLFAGRSQLVVYHGHVQS